MITDQADTIAPVIHSLILPPSAAPGETVTLGASVTDDRQVGEVRFMLSGAELGAAFLEPYEVVFQMPAEAAEGDLLSIQVEAVDTSGNAAAAEGTITVAAAPDPEPPFGVTLDGPAEAIAGRPLTLTAAATDHTGILKVTFLADGVEIAADPDSPYQAVYTVPASHIVGTQIRFTARAVDFAGNTAESDPLLVRVVAPGAGEISGRVYDDTRGLPVENAAVSLVSVHGEAPADIIEVYTDADGVYRIPAPEGTVVLRIDAPNTTAAWRTVSVKPDRVTPAYDARLTPLAEGVPVDHLAGADLTYGDLGADLKVTAGAFGEEAALTYGKILFTKRENIYKFRLQEKSEEREGKSFPESSEQFSHY